MINYCRDRWFTQINLKLLALNLNATQNEIYSNGKKYVFKNKFPNLIAFHHT